MLFTVISSLLNTLAQLFDNEWHSIRTNTGMKVIHIQQPKKELSLTQKFIRAMLSKDLDSFKATSRQFLRNNPAYFTGLGVIA